MTKKSTELWVSRDWVLWRTVYSWVGGSQIYYQSDDKN